MSDLASIGRIPRTRSEATNADPRQRVIDVLEAIERNDKTIYDYYGLESFNRDGRKPDSGRWETPRELAHDLLRELRADG